MNIIIIKRNGTKVNFDKNKIITAINSAFIDIDGELYETDTSTDIADDIEKRLIEANVEEISVEEIQNLVEEYLMQSERIDVARAYVRYRYKREAARNAENDFIKAIREKLDGKKIENQNANVDEASFGGRIGEASSVVNKKIALDYVVSPMARQNHLENMIYIHDLDAYVVGSHNCLSIPFDDLLAKGFNTRQTDVRPARSINTAFQLVAVIFQLQSLNQFGGVSATHLDWTMVPYVRMSFAKHFKDGIKYCCPNSRYDLDTLPKELSFDDPEANELFNAPAYKYAMDMTKRELEQAVEGMYHNLNTLQSRSGN